MSNGYRVRRCTVVNVCQGGEWVTGLAQLTRTGNEQVARQVKIPRQRVFSEGLQHE